MANSNENGDGAGPEAQEPDEPIEGLRLLRQEPSIGFLGKIKRSIHRRNLVSEAAELSWDASAEAIVEYVNLVFEMLTSKRTNKER